MDIGYEVPWIGEEPKSAIRLLCANMLSFCHLSFRLSVTMGPHCALKT